MNQNKQLLDISWETILKISVAAIFLYFLYLIKDLIIWFFFALVISILFEPSIKSLTKRKVPRVVATVVMYLLVVGIISFAFYSTLPFFLSEFQRFSQTFPQQLPGFFERVSPMFKGLGIKAFENFETFLSSIKQPFQKMSKNVFSTLFSIFGGLFATFFTVGVAIFLSLEKGLMEKGLTFVFPKKYEDYMLDLWKRSKKKVTGWFLMRIVGVFFVGLSSYLAFSILQVKYPISLGALAGILDFIPIIGPLVGGIIAAMIISVDSFLKAGFVLVAFGLIQVIENTILLPALSRRFIRVPPLLVLVGLFIGGKLWGVLGAILLVPLVAILFEFLKEFLQKRKEGFKFSSKTSKSG